MYVVLILVFGLAALAIAVPLANSLAKTFGAGMAQYLNFHPAPYVGYRSAFIQQVIVALVVPLLAAMLADLQQRARDRAGGDQRLWDWWECQAQR